MCSPAAACTASHAAGCCDPSRACISDACAESGALQQFLGLFLFPVVPVMMSPAGDVTPLPVSGAICYRTLENRVDWPGVRNHQRPLQLSGEVRVQRYLPGPAPQTADPLDSLH